MSRKQTRKGLILKKSSILAILMLTALFLAKSLIVIPDQPSMELPDRPVEMIRTAEMIQKHSKTIMIAVVNDAFLPFAYSWLCNTKDMGIHKHVLFLTTDQHTSDQLKRGWPEVNVASFNMSGMNGDRQYGEAGYMRLNIKRHQYINELLKAGFELFNFEVDCVWLRNPLPVLQSYVGYDLVVNEVSDSKQYAGGFFYIYNTKRSIKVWELLAEELADLGRKIASFKDLYKISGQLNDQHFLSDIIQNNRVEGLKSKVLKLDTFSDGLWYTNENYRKHASDPYIINNNFIVGNTAKIERAKRWNHWFINDSMRCNMDLVYRIVKH